MELGPLELEILHLLGEMGASRPLEVHLRLQATHPVAYTTVEEFLALARTLAVERAGDAQEVNRLVDQFKQMQKLMKQMKGAGMFNPGAKLPRM